jgi:hypothetical protein
MDPTAVNKIKLNITEKYELSKKALNSKNITYNIKPKALDTEYNNVITNIDKEYNNFKHNKSHYSIIIDATYKTKKLNIELNKYSTNFLNKINPLINANYSVIEQELNQYNKIQEGILSLENRNIQIIAKNAEFLKQNIELMKKNTIYISDSDKVTKATTNGYWF